MIVLFLFVFFLLITGLGVWLLSKLLSSFTEKTKSVDNGIPINTIIGPNEPVQQGNEPLPPKEGEAQVDELSLSENKTLAEPHETNRQVELSFPLEETIPLLDQPILINPNTEKVFLYFLLSVFFVFSIIYGLNGFIVNRAYFDIIVLSVPDFRS